MKRNNKTSFNRGFALLATVLMMVLLVIITIGTLNLSTVSIRTVSHESAEKIARSNARMALMIAIGELQNHTGQDTRVTATANLFDEDNPMILGVWRSWEGLDHEASGSIAGRPKTPNYEIKDVAYDDASPASGRFLSWLISTARTAASPDISDAINLAHNSPTTGTVPLLSKGSLRASDSRELHVVPTEIEGGGRYAWWISGENQKARLQQPYEPKTDDLAGSVEMMQTHHVPDPGAFELESLIDDKEPYRFMHEPAKPARRAITRRTIDLLDHTGSESPALNFHDLSSNSVGLLTNVATGGWRKDLSILSERYNEIYGLDSDGKLPLFRISPSEGDVTRVSMPNLGDLAPQGSLFYPWSGYPANAGSTTLSHQVLLTRSGASASWLSLLDFANSYKSVDYDSSAQTLSADATLWPYVRDAVGISHFPEDNRSAYFNSMHKNPRNPIIARVQFVFFARAVWTNTVWKYQIELMAKPVITLWNPYSVALKIDKPTMISWDKSLPMVVSFNNERINPNPVLDNPADPNAPKHWHRLITGTNGYGGYDGSIPINIARRYNRSIYQSQNVMFRFPETLTLAPGECGTFSTTEMAVDGSTGVLVQGESGYDGAIPAGWLKGGTWGSWFTGVYGNNSNAPNWNDPFKIYMRFDYNTKYSNNPAHVGPGVLYRYGVQMNGIKYIKDFVNSYVAVTNEEFANHYWQMPVDLPAFRISEIAVTTSSGGTTTNPPWTPMFSVILGPRITVGMGAGNPQDRPTKGLLQNNPFASTVLTTNAKEPANHPINNHFEFAIHAHVNGGSDTLPEDTEAEGYMMTGAQIGNGLSRMVLTDVPARPLASLVELQHWNAQGGKPLPPYQYFVIGNSDAPPMIPRDGVVPSLPTSDPRSNLVHDDSYCANHLLFDDWCFSTISPGVAGLGRIVDSPMEDVYRNFLKGDEILPNRSYQLSSELTGLPDPEIDQLVSDTLDSADGWMNVTSQLEVDGMFNVNSTSVKAWRALLGHARDMDIHYHTKNGITEESNPVDYAVSRTHIAGDVKADPEATGAGGKFPGASEYSGFRTFSDADLHELAEKMVEQIRERGPFLSLSEFVNRKLDNDENLSMVGAVQAALNNLSNNPNQFLATPGNASKTIDSANPLLAGVDIYENDKAAEGFNTFGLPGWVTQADVLRPIAPILSARDDTFTIRAYGDALDANGKIIARAWCEATVSRSRNFLDSSDLADSTEPPKNNMNQRFGRRYKLNSFRWLAANEI